MAKYKVNREILRYLREALRAARCERCAVDAEAQEAMRLYLDTWVVAPLETAYNMMTGEDANAPGAAFTAYAKDRVRRGLAPLDQDPKRCTCRPNGADGSYTGSEAPCDHCMARRIADADVNPEGYFRE